MPPKRAVAQDRDWLKVKRLERAKTGLELLFLLLYTCSYSPLIAILTIVNTLL
jgi:hypothetical protein